MFLYKITTNLKMHKNVLNKHFDNNFIPSWKGTKNSYAITISSRYNTRTCGDVLDRNRSAKQNNLPMQARLALARAKMRKTSYEWYRAIPRSTERADERRVKHDFSRIAEEERSGLDELSWKGDEFSRERTEKSWKVVCGYDKGHWKSEKIVQMEWKSEFRIIWKKEAGRKVSGKREQR